MFRRLLESVSAQSREAADHPPDPDDPDREFGIIAQIRELLGKPIPAMTDGDVMAAVGWAGAGASIGGGISAGLFPVFVAAGLLGKLRAKQLATVTNDDLVAALDELRSEVADIHAPARIDQEVASVISGVDGSSDKAKILRLVADDHQTLAIQTIKAIIEGNETVLGVLREFESSMQRQFQQQEEAAQRRHEELLALLGKREKCPDSRPSNLPDRLDPKYFVGRAAELTDLAHAVFGSSGPTAITQSQSVNAVHGTGGVGKTRLAVEFAHAYAQYFSAILFVDSGSSAPPANRENEDREAESAESALLRAFAGLGSPAEAELGGVLNLWSVEDPPEPARQRGLVLRYLQENPGWLLIFDNVDTPEARDAVDRLREKLPAGDVLITSRLSSWPGSIHKVALDLLDLDSATAYLLDRTDGNRAEEPTGADDARELAARLDRLPVALEQAAAYIAKRHVSFREYLTAWKSRLQSVADQDFPHTRDYRKTTYAVWQTTVDVLSPGARDLLFILCQLAPAPVSQTMLDVAREEMDPPLLAFVENDAADVPDINDALDELCEFHLLQWDGQSRSYEMLRIVHEITGDKIPNDKRSVYGAKALAWSDVLLKIDPTDVRSWTRIGPAIPHALLTSNRWVKTIEMYLKRDRNDLPQQVAAATARVLNQTGRYLEARAEYNEAEPLYRRSIQIDGASFGPDHPNVAIRLGNLAGLLQATNRVIEAEALFRTALQIDEASFGPNHPQVATDLNNLAELLRVTNRMAEAEPLFRRSLRIDEASYGCDHQNIAKCLNNLALLLQETGRMDEAEQLFRRVVTIFETSLGPDHPNVATSLNNLAGLLYATNRTAEAEPLYRRSLQIDEASYGTDHPIVAIRLNNLAGLLYATNRMAEAEPLYRRVVAIFEESLGPDHPNVATSLNNLAGLLEATNRMGEAEPLYRRSLQIDEASFGPDHPNVAIRLNNLAGLLKATNRMAEAEPLSRRHLVIFLRFTFSTGHKHPHLNAAFQNYGGLLVDMGRSQEEADAEVRRLVDEVKAELGTPDSTAQDSLAT